MIGTGMTTSIDISLDALAAAGTAASAEADEEARAAGIKPAGLLKRVRVRMPAGKSRLIRTISAPNESIRLKQRPGSRKPPARKLGS
jgi:hypothetical protein